MNIDESIGQCITTNLLFVLPMFPKDSRLISSHLLFPAHLINVYQRNKNTKKQSNLPIREQTCWSRSKSVDSAFAAKTCCTASLYAFGTFIYKCWIRKLQDTQTSQWLRIFPSSHKGTLTFTPLLSIASGIGKLKSLKNSWNWRFPL